MNFITIILVLIFAICIVLYINGINMTAGHLHPDIRFWWGILMISSAVVITIEGIIVLSDIDAFLHPKSIPFSMRLIFEWQWIALLVAMLSISGLRYKLSNRQIILCICIIIANFITILSYHFISGGVYTNLKSFSDIFRNISQPDVMIKVILFVISILSTTYLLYVPMFKSLIIYKSKVTPWFWIYMFFTFLQPITYCLYAFKSPYSGAILGIGCSTFIILFSFAFKKRDNPMIR